MIMTPTHRTLTMRAVLLAVPVGLLITFAGVTGCAASGQQVLPAALETRLAAQANADDHFAAAMPWRNSIENLAAGIECSDARRPAHLVTGKGDKIAA